MELVVCKFEYILQAIDQNDGISVLYTIMNGKELARTMAFFLHQEPIFYIDMH